METATELRHLRREVKTAVELAIVSLAPTEMVETLAMSAGLLEAVSELPADSAPAVAMSPRMVERARKALEEWSAWEAKHVKKATA